MNETLDFLPPLTVEDLPPGDFYVGAFLRAEIAKYFDEVKIRLDFELMEPPSCAGVIVSAFCKYPSRNSNRRHSPGSKFFRLWTLANGGPPLRGQRLALKVFQGYWKLRLRWGISNGRSGIPKGELTNPVVDQLLQRVAGGAVKNHVNSDTPSAAEIVKSFVREGGVPLLPELRGR